MTGPDDGQLWARLEGGDADALGLLFDRYATPVHAALARRAGDGVDSEALVGAVFLTAWEKRSSVSLDSGAVLPWLLGVAGNTARNANRAQRRYRAALARLPVEDVEPDHADEAAARVDLERDAGRVQAALGALPAHEREALQLAARPGMASPAAVAAALGVPVGTAKSRISRGRRRLAGLLGQDDREGS